MTRQHQSHRISVNFVQQTGMYGFVTEGFASNARNDAASTTVTGALDKAKRQIDEDIEAKSRRSRTSAR